MTDPWEKARDDGYYRRASEQDYRLHGTQQEYEAFGYGARKREEDDKRRTKERNAVYASLFDHMNSNSGTIANYSTGGGSWTVGLIGVAIILVSTGIFIYDVVNNPYDPRNRHHASPPTTYGTQQSSPSFHDVEKLPDDKGVGFGRDRSSWLAIRKCPELNDARCPITKVPGGLPFDVLPGEKNGWVRVKALEPISGKTISGYVQAKLIGVQNY